MLFPDDKNSRLKIYGLNTSGHAIKTGLIAYLIALTMISITGSCHNHKAHFLGLANTRRIVALYENVVKTSNPKSYLSFLFENHLSHLNNFSRLITFQAGGKCGQ